MSKRPRLAVYSGQRATVVACGLLGGVAAYLYLDLSLQQIWPAEGGLALAKRFFARALSPALRSEGASIPGDAPSLLSNALDAAIVTFEFAAAALSLSLLCGLILGVLASETWWKGICPPERSGPLRRRLGQGGHLLSRGLIAAMRSIHELLWAVLFLAAMGLGHGTAIAALAIPYAGTLAKIFSELIDELPKQPAMALEGAGAGQLQCFLFGIIPGVLPDLGAYTFYRFECALRSAAVLGFFGYPTLGYYLRQSFENTLYGEVWTYLYTLLVLVVGVELWSGAIRARLVA